MAIGPVIASALTDILGKIMPVSKMWIAATELINYLIEASAAPKCLLPTAIAIRKINMYIVFRETLIPMSIQIVMLMP